MKPVAIVIADHTWTVKAMHLACALSRNTQSSLILLDFRRTKNIALLGTGIGYDTPTMAEYVALRDYFMIAEDYGVPMTIQPVEYISHYDALVQMVELFMPTTLFAKAPKSLIPALGRLSIWQARKQLEHLNCKLYTLDESYRKEEILVPKMGVPMLK
ncbi:MAG: hypothetical protein SFZ02_09445 [bacterium]|nr:hypothetical protein [bacterium]